MPVDFPKIHLTEPRAPIGALSEGNNVSVCRSQSEKRHSTHAWIAATNPNLPPNDSHPGRSRNLELCGSNTNILSSTSEERENEREGGIIVKYLLIFFLPFYTLM